MVSVENVLCFMFKKIEVTVLTRLREKGNEYFIYLFFRKCRPTIIGASVAQVQTVYVVETFVQLSPTDRARQRKSKVDCFCLLIFHVFATKYMKT